MIKSLNSRLRSGTIVMAMTMIVALVFNSQASESKNDKLKAMIDVALQKVYPALVQVQVITMRPRSGRLKKYQSAGSGVIIDKQGHVVTNHHVAGKSKRLVCRLSNGDEVEADLVGSDPLADIAIIKLRLDDYEGKLKPIPTAEFGDSDKVKVGDTVLAMGCPVALSQSVTKGIVSNTALTMPKLFWPFNKMTVDGENVGSLVLWLGHDAAIYGGNSGGPLVNLAGEIIGVNDIGIGLGGAIPGNLAKSVAKQLIETGTVKRSWVGGAFQPLLKSSKVKKGVLVGGVIKDSPADKAGLEGGDIMIEFDGKPVSCRLSEEMPILNQIILSTPIAKKVKIKVLRDGAEKTLELTTEARGLAKSKDEELRNWGLTVRNFTRLSALKYKRPDQNGIQVLTLRPGGAAAEAKPPLKNKDVIVKVAGKDVKNIKDIQKITAELTKGQEEKVPVAVEFERKKAKLLTVLKIGKEPEDEKPGLAKKAWFSAVTQVLTKDMAEALGLKGKTGVRIVQIFPKRNVEKAGLKVGDIILKLDDEKIDASTPEDKGVFPNMIRQYKIGSEAKLDIVSDGKAKQITLKLEEPPVAPSELTRYSNDDFEITFRDLAFVDKNSQMLDEDTKGVLIERVEYAGWAALAHIALNDVLLSINGEATPDVKTVEKILKAVREKKSKRVVFKVRRGLTTLFLEIEPNWQ